MRTFQMKLLAKCGFFAGVTIGLATSAVGAAPPPAPDTAAEIEHALSVPGKAEPDLKLRDRPGSGGTGALKLRGVAGVVEDPAAGESSPPANTSSSTDLSSPDTLDYPTLIRGRRKIAALIHFDPKSAHIRSDAYPLLNEYVSALQSPALRDAVLVIAGHTDSMGSEEANLSLSQERAQAVKDYLIKRGINTNRLIAKGYGEAYPVATNATTVGRELNRRSEFIRIDR